MILSTDSTANLPKELYKKYNIKMIPMQINLNDVTYNDLSDDLPVETYYQKMREGSTPTTAQINEYNAKEYFENFMYRLILNGESHTCDETKIVEFFDYTSREEKIRIFDNIIELLMKEVQKQNDSDLCETECRQRRQLFNRDTD